MYDSPLLPPRAAPLFPCQFFVHFLHLSSLLAYVRHWPRFLRTAFSVNITARVMKLQTSKFMSHELVHEGHTLGFLR
jgi:hypothetical protein